ncbi:MAG: GAF domain-containing sensor histidine kinase [Chloroflexota bacterium]|nr:GAF domain-containing sensor histidine kinase [Chloroflexota bacterium]
MSGTRQRSGFSGRIRAAALVLPALLLSILVALDHFVLEPVLGPATSHLAVLIIGVAGMFAFSTAIFARLTELHERDQEQSARSAELARDLERRGTVLQALNEAGLALAAEFDPAAVLQRIVDLSRSVGDARYAALGIFDEGGRVREFITSGITAEERARIGPLPKGLGILGLLPRGRHSIRLRDLKEHPASVEFPAHHPPMHSFLGVPILWRGESVGNLYLTEKLGAPEFTTEDEEALITFAAQAAIAIENARLYAQLERVVVLEERQRIGMDLHDGAIQSLYGIGLMLEDVAARLDAEPEASRKVLDRGVDRLNATIADLRSYVLGLTPVRTSGRPLRESIAELSAQAASNALLDVVTEIAPDVDDGLDDATREAAFFIVADALANVARHARASKARVRLTRGQAVLVVEMEDDGVGFDPASRVEGLGLRNMRQRAFSAGGWVTVESVPGSGTRIRVELPARASGGGTAAVRSTP